MKTKSDTDKIILVVDTAMNACSAGVWDAKAGTILAQRTNEMLRGHAEHLIPMIVEILKQAKIEFQDLDYIAVTKGPGAFTGMRIGLATAKALSLSLGIPAIGISTCEALLESARHQVPENIDQEILVLIETKRDDFYVQKFKQDFSTKTPPAALTFDQIMPLIEDVTALALLGDAIPRFEELSAGGVMAKVTYKQELVSPTIEAIAKLSLKAVREGGVAGTIEPEYVRPPDVSMPKTPPPLLVK